MAKVCLFVVLYLAAYEKYLAIRDICYKSPKYNGEFLAGGHRIRDFLLRFVWNCLMSLYFITDLHFSNLWSFVAKFTELGPAKLHKLYRAASRKRDVQRDEQKKEIQKLKTNYTQSLHEIGKHLPPDRLELEEARKKALGTPSLLFYCCVLLPVCFVCSVFIKHIVAIFYASPNSQTFINDDVKRIFFACNLLCL